MVERGLIRAYAAATNETHPAFIRGDLAPPVFAILPAWESIHEASRSIVPEEVRPRVVHGEQDMFLYAPLEPGIERFARPVRPGDSLTTRLWQVAPDVLAFEATNGEDEVVIRDGRAELTSAR